MQDRLWQFAATELAQAVRIRPISNPEAKQAVGDRIAAVNLTISAIVDVLAQEAQAAMPTPIDPRGQRL